MRRQDSDGRQPGQRGYEPRRPCSRDARLGGSGPSTCSSRAGAGGAVPSSRAKPRPEFDTQGPAEGSLLSHPGERPS
jgi:hypothetical protein